MSFQGIIKYDGKVFTNYTLKENLIHFHVFSVMEDKSGNIWFGTVRGGVYKYNGKTFTLFTTNDGLVDDLIYCMMEDKNGNIWFGTDGGVSRLDTSVLRRTSTNSAITTLSGLSLPSKKGFTNYTTDNGLCGNRINSIIQDKNGKIWIGTRSGVSCYDGKSFTNFTIKGLPFTNVHSIMEDKAGKIWVSGQDGLYCYDPSVTDETSLTKLMSKFTCYLFEDKAGNLWFSAEEGKGMTLYKYDKKAFTKIIDKTDDGDNQIFEVTEDKNGNIWFGKMAGVCRYDGKTFNYFKK
jgi:ligand-binding sensor domain-containing protein